MIISIGQEYNEDNGQYTSTALSHKTEAFKTKFSEHISAVRKNCENQIVKMFACITDAPQQLVELLNPRKINLPSKE